MILVDVNVALYAYDVASPWNSRARPWLEAAVGGATEVRFGLQSILAFIRISTSPAVFETPLEPREATAIAVSWLDHPNVGLASPGDRHWAILADLAEAGQVRGAGMMDAHLAALAIEHGATLATTDRGFARFPGLRFENPIAE